MREGMGLYRGKRLDNGEWVEGNLLTSKDGAPDRDFAEILVKDKHGYGVMWHEVDIETICQWTGLVDKNGVKIFEGDILHSDYGENYKVFYTTKSCSFMAECTQGNAPMLGNYRMGECWSNTIAVIGSIHDKAVEE